MKKVTATILLVIPLYLHSTAITLKEALAKGIVSVSVKQIPSEQRASAAGGHYGECLQMTIKNLTAKAQTITMESGYFLEPYDTTTQRMMVAQSITASVAASGSVTKKIKAFCSQKHDHSPNATSKFRLGSLAAGLIYKIAKWIEAKKYFTSRAQNAVWVTTDNADYYPSDDENQEDKDIRSWLKENNLGHKIVSNTPGATTTPSEPQVSVKLLFSFETENPCKVTVQVVNAIGTLVAEPVKDQEFAAGPVKVEFWISNRDLRRGKYTARYLVNGELLHSKPFNL